MKTLAVANVMQININKFKWNI